jgi:hypothetical protein
MGALYLSKSGLINKHTVKHTVKQYEFHTIAGSPNKHIVKHIVKHGFNQSSRHKSRSMILNTGIAGRQWQCDLLLAMQALVV